MYSSYYEKVDSETICIDDEIQFDVPDSWMWCRLGSCCTKEIKRGKSPKYAEGKTLVFAQKCNTKYSGISMTLALRLDESTIAKYPIDEFMLDKDIVINSTGTGTLGRVGMFRESDNHGRARIVPDSHVAVVRTHLFLNAEYVYAYLKCKQPLLEEMGEGSTNQKELKPISLINLLVPVPPYAEQCRIVDLIKNFNRMCDTIEASLR